MRLVYYIKNKIERKKEEKKQFGSQGPHSPTLTAFIPCGNKRLVANFFENSMKLSYRSEKKKKWKYK